MDYLIFAIGCAFIIGGWGLALYMREVRRRKKYWVDPPFEM